MLLPPGHDGRSAVPW
ncbi:putative serine/arginine repetitive matrix protein 1 isoform X1 [Iris pallida]|uniref:Serine/arginine repetitive matrix protein 1 isoform X1 n=1 Tax=Iris pallida TaxID=29817 RepID=A0AAX6DRX2_IRIPA|nr:putative serine/arginine repetitive matrix protein 1 isoform X1 [Iris pallida]KAJ6794981.1 putative serine/arginine repetitive matrix protein 1 isoform X1 [Iris pallida]